MLNPTPDQRPSPPEVAQLELLEPSEPPRSPYWGFGATIGFGLLIFAVFFAVQALVAIPFLLPALMAEFPNIPDPDRVAEIAAIGLMLAIATIVSGTAGIALMVPIIKARKTIGIREYLALGPVTLKMVLLSVFAAMALQLVSNIALMFADPEPPEFMFEIYRTAVWPPLLWIAVVGFASAFEEAFFRGFLFAGLRQSRLGVWGTILLTSVTWAALHVQYEPFIMGVILIMGIALGVVRHTTNSLWPPLIIHAVWNLIAMIQTAATVSAAGSILALL